tara:strand:- start:1727 stop:2572 length:846 start_codon:yes stop_codon:yes gene_type:complete
MTPLSATAVGKAWLPGILPREQGEKKTIEDLAKTPVSADLWAHYHKREVKEALVTKKTSAISERLIICIDQDCFYAQVIMIENPSLKDKPLAVTQKHIIATCNYPARKFGLSKLMLIEDAVSMCPEITLVSGEDLTRFREASSRIYACVVDYIASIVKQHVRSGSETRSHRGGKSLRQQKCMSATHDSLSNNYSSNSAQNSFTFANNSKTDHAEELEKYLMPVIEKCGFDEMFLDVTNLISYCVHRDLRVCSDMVRYLNFSKLGLLIFGIPNQLFRSMFRL